MATFSNPFRLAWDKVHTVLLDLRYGAILRGVMPTRYASLGANDTASSDYAGLKQMFADRIRPSDVLVDVGCGKGRVINWWLSRGYRNKIVGIELDDQLALGTRERLRRYSNVTILSGDALEILPNDGTIFYLFHPFNAEVLKRFHRRLRGILATRPAQSIIVVYYNCIHLEVLRADPLCAIEEGKCRHPYAIITLRST